MKYKGCGLIPTKHASTVKVLRRKQLLFDTICNEKKQNISINNRLICLCTKNVYLIMSYQKLADIFKWKTRFEKKYVIAKMEGTFVYHQVN